MALTAMAGNAATSSSPPGSSTTLTDLPPELIDYIAKDLLDIASLKALRLVCRTTNATAERGFIKECIKLPKIYLDQTGVSGLHQLAKSRWGKDVQGLSLHALRLYPAHDIEGSAETQAGIQQKPAVTDWITSRAAVTPLADALKMLPQLRSLEVRHQLRPAGSLEEAASVVLSALNSSGVTLERLSLGDPRGWVWFPDTLNMEWFSLAVGAKSGLSHLLTNIRRLDLSLDTCNVIEGMEDTIRNWLGTATSLETLQISYSVESYTDGDCLAYGFTLLIDGLVLPKLSTLRLSELRSSSYELSKFLKAHQKTLKALHLRNLIIEADGSIDNLYEYFRTSCGLTALTELSLSQIRIDEHIAIFDADACEFCHSMAPYCFEDEACCEDDIIDARKRLCPHVTLKAGGSDCISAVIGRTEILDPWQLD